MEDENGRNGGLLLRTREIYNVSQRVERNPNIIRFLKESDIITKISFDKVDRMI